MEFIHDNWLAMVSLLVALIGGVPGVITVINQRKNRPIFRFDLVTFITGRTCNGTHTMILLSGTASNEGNTVLSPARFDLECKVDAAWVKFEAALIQEDAQFLSSHQDIQIDSASQNDLQKYSGTITTGMPLNGHLMFHSPSIPLEKVRDNPSLQMRLICRDIFGKKHVTSVRLLPSGNRACTTHPKHGINIVQRECIKNIDDNRKDPAGCSDQDV